MGSAGAKVRPLGRALVLSPRHERQSDSHHRHRSGAQADRLGRDRQRRGEARLRGLRLGRVRRWREPRKPPAPTFRRPLRGAGAALPTRGGDRADLRQSRCLGHAQARPGARHCHARAGAARALNRRICAERGEEDGGRRRSRRQGPDPRHGEMPPAARGPRQHRCRRRARHRHHPCPFAKLGRARGAGRASRGEGSLP